jgi:hypothetical protein
MKWLKKLFEKKKVEVAPTEQLNIPVVRKRFCVKPIGEICFGDETDSRCGNCGHWI